MNRPAHWLLASCALVTAAALRAQCSTPWLAGNGIAGANAQVAASVVWDADGAGPLPPLLVVGGKFTMAGTAVGPAIAAYDPANGVWSRLGTLSGTMFNELRVRALAVAPNGDLIAGGNFLYADGQPVANLARYHGNAWETFGNGIGGYVNAIACRPNGDIVVAGNFPTAGGVTANRIAIWNGTTWAAMGSGPDQAINALAALPNGDVVAAGQFTTISGVAANHIARWDGATWTPLGSGLSHAAWSVAVDAAGGVVASGPFSDAGGVSASAIARWDGTAWSPLGAGLSNPAWSIVRCANGDLVVGGVFTQAGGSPAMRIARWNGSAWAQLGSGLGMLFPVEDVLTVAELPGGDIVGGGEFTSTGGHAIRRLARWNGTAWTALHGETTGIVTAIATFANGDAVVGGSFSMLDGIATNRIARRVGTTWQPLGSGVDGDVLALVRRANGDVIAGGKFAHAGAAAANHVARWNGSAWYVLGVGLSGDVLALTELANGDLIAAGSFPERVARWNGSQWVSLQPPAGAYPPNTLFALPTGDLLAAGNLAFGADDLARWDGSAWSTYPDSYNGKFAVSANGELFAASGAAVLRWDGSAWVPYGTATTNPIARLHVLANGTLAAVIGLSLIPPITLPLMFPAEIRILDGTTWTAAHRTDASIHSMANAPNGDLLVGGEFTRVDTTGSAAFAQRTTTCPAAVTPFGTACAGALSASSLPWIGATFRSTATGLPANGLALDVLGLTATAVPLATILPVAGAGCTLLVSPLLLDVALPQNGTASLALPLPNTASLVGATVRQQVVALAFDASGNLVAAQSTQGLSITIGAM